MARRALDLNPLCPSWYHTYVALPLFALKRYEEALEAAGKSPPGLVVDTPAYKAAACAYLGRNAEAARYLEEFRADFSARIACGRELGATDELFRWTLHVNPYRRDEDTRHLAEGLRRAGLEGRVARPTPGPPIPWPLANIFRVESGVWTLSFEGRVAQITDRRGLHDLRRLLARPGVEIAATELAGAKLVAAGVERADTRALGAYRARLRELDADLAQAEESGDARRAVRLEEEKESLLAEIRKATGLGGRTRRVGGADERSRTAVTWRIRDAIRKIAEIHPALGRHLLNSIRTGALCAYRPERPTDWQV